MSSSSEPDLIDRCLVGDPSAWNKLFDDHYSTVVRFVFQLSPELSKEDAEEIAQETFLSVIKNLKSFNKKSSLQTWIIRIAINKTHDYIIKQKAEKRGGGAKPLSINANDEDGEIKIDIPDSKFRPDENILKNEEYQILFGALEKLGNPCKEVIELRYFAELSYEEIAQAIDAKPKTVSSRLSKCLDKLETILKNELKREKIP